MVRIIVKHNVDMHRQMTKKVSPLSARRELDENIKRETDNAQSGSIQDRQQAIREAAKWQKTLDRSSPETLTVDAKNAMWKRAKLLKDAFCVGMLTTDELHPVSMKQFDGAISTVVDTNKMQSINAVQRQLAWNKKNEDKVREYKNIMRHLCPDNPAATDIEKFRNHRGTA